MNPKEENEKLKKENAQIIESINISRGVLEEIQAKEKEGKKLLNQLADEVEVAVANSQVIKDEVVRVSQEILTLEVTKKSLETEIDTLKQEALTTVKATIDESSEKLRKIEESIVVKQAELTEVLGKIKDANFNLGTLKSDISGAEVKLDGLNLKMKQAELHLQALAETKQELTTEIEVNDQKLADIQNQIKDAEISLEVYEHRKQVVQNKTIEARQVLESLSEKITELKKEIETLEAQKEEKDTEYKASESKIFALLQREEAVTEREEYAKERFRTAGLEY